MNTPAPFSSMLFVPGNRPDRVEKALGSLADIICIDLEDAVPPSEKDKAREYVCAGLQEWNRDRLVVRMNSIRTKDGLKDLLQLTENPALPASLFLPKVDNPGQLDIISEIIGSRLPGVIALIETISGLNECSAIAAHPITNALMLGVADLSAELGCALDWEPLLMARSRIVAAAKQAGVTAIDGPYVDFKNITGLETECQRSVTLGFDAKAALHPVQLAAITQAFRPSQNEVLEAREALVAFEEAGGGAVTFNGKLLEAPIVKRLSRIAAFGEI